MKAYLELRVKSEKQKRTKVICRKRKLLPSRAGESLRSSLHFLCALLWVSRAPQTVCRRNWAKFGEKLQENWAPQPQGAQVAKEEEKSGRPHEQTMSSSLK